MINQLSGDLQQGGCLYQPTRDIQWIHEHSSSSGRPQKQASPKADSLTFGSGVPVISKLLDGAND